MADRDRLARKPREGLVGKIGIGEFLQQLAAIGTRKHQHTEPRGDRIEDHRAVSRRKLLERVVVVPLEGAG